MSNLAYDLSLYDRSERVQPSIKVLERRTKRLHRIGKLFYGMLVSLICFISASVVLLYIYGKAEETKWQSNINQIKTELSEQESYNKTLYFKVMCEQNQEKLEEYIQEHHLVKFENTQIQYLFFENDDVVNLAD